MIGFLTGKIQNISINKNSVIINIGGVGYVVFITNTLINTLHKNDDIELYTHLNVKENSLDLYGFISKDEKQFFELLINISGVGPKSALGILSLADINTLTTAISNSNSEYLTKVSGIGKKLAQKIIIELKDKVYIEKNNSKENILDDADVVAALETLGYKQQEIRDAIQKIPDAEQGINARVSAALKILGK